MRFSRYLLLVLIALLLWFLIFNVIQEYKFWKDTSNSLVEPIDTSGGLNVPAPTAPQSVISIDYLRSRTYEAEAPVTEEELSSGSNYDQSIVSYKSDDLKIFGLLTVPTGSVPEGGYPAIVFNHGYIPPKEYITTEKYVPYVDYLAKNGFVVFKIDFRGHGKSEGTASGTYFSPGYTIDAINALKSLQKLEFVNPERIGIWGHSMSGNLSLRAMLVSEEFKAGVIWSGAVYSYEDFAKYRLNDSSYVRRHFTSLEDVDDATQQNVTRLRNLTEELDFNDAFWDKVSLTKNIRYLKGSLQLHHAVNDEVVNIGYSRDLSDVLSENKADFEIFEYEGGGHNISSPYFEQAMLRTVKFFKDKL